MTMLTVPAALALVAVCAPTLDPHLMVGIAQHESGLNTDIVHLNRDGSQDFGLFQINSGSFRLLNITSADALDPCKAAIATAHLIAILSRYNTGNPATGVSNGYALAALNSIHDIHSADDRPTAVPSPAEMAPLEDRPANDTETLEGE